MKNWLLYVLLTLAFAFIASGVVVSAFIDTYQHLGLQILWLLLPVTLLFMVGVLIDVRYAIPRLLMRQRYYAYFLMISGMSYVASLMSIVMEYAVRTGMGLPSRIKDYSSPWIYVDAFSSSVLLTLILSGIGARMLFRTWTKVTRREKRMADELRQYISTVKNRLNVGYIKESLKAISERLYEFPAETASRIRTLSDYLRSQLYEMPVPPVQSGSEASMSDYPGLANFITGSRCRLTRHCLFQFVLIAISFGTFFNAPDRPEFAENAAGFVVMYLFLNLLAYINIMWLFRRFKRSGSLKKYIREIGLLLLAVIIPLIVMQTATYDMNPYDKQLPVPLVVISTMGTVITLFFFIGGTAAVMIFQDWVKGQRRLTLLHAETVRQEYAFLKKQINPHFLFNVLNNIGILSVDEPAEAADMLSELRKLIDYQFDETERNTTRLGREIRFLQSYLSLEATRIEPFEFEMTAETEIEEVLVPTLLFIPFVENAVKYSCVVEGVRRVEISFIKEDDYILFRCDNTYCQPEAASGQTGGIGVSNTLRRLNLLFGNDFEYSRSIDVGRYSVVLTIPAK